MAKFQKKNRDAVITAIVIGFAVLVVAAIVATVLLFPKDDARRDEQPEQIERTNAEAFLFEIPGFTLTEDAQIGTVNDQLRVIGAGSYTGPYMEDGSDEAVADVLAIVVQNISEEWVENADLTLDCGGDTAQFSVSALPGSTCALLLESNRLAFEDDMTLRNPVCVFCANDMTGKNVDFSEDFSLQPYEGDILVLQNISGHEFTGDVVLYYKNVAPYGKSGELLYLGGIAYANRFEGPIAVNDMRQVKPSHYTLGGSAILFMSYDS
ncbi:MAG: hypothetical protein IJG45_05790 [Oscillospiraceae bacterium]|nr:hypothetical protein [Oscillospiraceae bacterium]